MRLNITPWDVFSLTAIVIYNNLVFGQCYDLRHPLLATAIEAWAAAEYQTASQLFQQAAREGVDQCRARLEPE